MTRQRAARRLFAAVGWLCASCSLPERAEPRIVAEFGVFFGGQIQERNEIPFELDRSRQLVGFRVQMSPPPPEPLEVFWELSLPPAARKPGARGSAPQRRSKSGSLRMRAGESRLEQPLPFAPDDPLGLWNIRVHAAERLLIDRPFNVYDQKARAEAEQRRNTQTDAGL